MAVVIRIGEGKPRAVSESVMFRTDDSGELQVSVNQEVRDGIETHNSWRQMTGCFTFFAEKVVFK